MESHCFKPHRSYLISSNLSNVGKIFWVESERTISKFQKKNFSVVLTYSIKRASETRKFHVAVVQQRLRNAPAKLFLCQSKPIAFFAGAKTPYCCDPDIWLPFGFSSLLFLTNTYGRFQFFFLKKQRRNDCTMEFHQAYEFNVAEPRE